VVWTTCPLIGLFPRRRKAANFKTRLAAFLWVEFLKFSEN
jgi:hypothetical protein